jgi:predicted amino acid-binding ACT domain protein
MNDLQASTPLLSMTLSPFPDPPAESPFEMAVLKVSGLDRIGVTSGVGRWLSDQSVNVEAGMARIFVSTRGEPRRLYGALYMLSADVAGMGHLREMIRTASLPAPDAPDDPGAEAESDRLPLRYQLDLLADDEPGILGRVARTLSRNGINIVAHSCDTDFSRGPAKPRPRRGLFSLRMEVDVPREGSARALDRVDAELRACRSKRGWNVSFEENLSSARIGRALSGIIGCGQLEFAGNFPF